jgi:hypothetical protein
VYLQDVFKLLSLRRDKQHAYSNTLEVKSTVEVHYLVFRPLLWRGHLDFSPF